MLIVAFPQSVMDEELAATLSHRCTLGWRPIVKALWSAAAGWARLSRSSSPGSGWDVTVLDENEDSLARLGEHWTGGFVVGHGMDLKLLREGGHRGRRRGRRHDRRRQHEHRDRPGGQKQFEVPTVVVRVLDPARAEFYAERG